MFESDFIKHNALTGQQFSFLYSKSETNSTFGVLFLQDFVVNNHRITFDKPYVRPKQCFLLMKTVFVF